MATAFSQLDILLKERVSPAIRNLQLPDDDIAWNLMSSFEPENVGGRRDYNTTASDFPAGYMAKEKIKVQSGGRVTGGRFGGPTMTRMGASNHLMAGQGLDALYLDPTTVPSASYIEVAMVLCKVLGSIVMNEEQINVRLISEPLEDVTMDLIEDATRRFRKYVMNMFWGDGTGAIARVNGTVSIVEASPTVVEIDNGTYARFMKGDILQAGTDASPSVQVAGAIAGRMYVTSVDPDNRRIKLQSLPGEGTISLTDNSRLYYDESYTFGGASDAVNKTAPEGVGSLLINSGVFPGSATLKFPSGLDVGDHEELKAFIQGTAGTVDTDPTMENMTILLDKMMSTVREDMPSVLIAEPSVWTLASILDKDSRSTVQVPQGQLYSPTLGVGAPILRHRQRTFARFDSDMVRENTVVGLNPGKWKRFIPLGDRTIRFKYGTGVLSGFPSVFGPINVGSRLSESAQAPFYGAIQFTCAKPQSQLIRHGVKAQRDMA